MLGGNASHESQLSCLTDIKEKVCLVIHNFVFVVLIREMNGTILTTGFKELTSVMN